MTRLWKRTSQSQALEVTRAEVGSLGSIAGQLSGVSRALPSGRGHSVPAGDTAGSGHGDELRGLEGQAMCSCDGEAGMRIRTAHCCQHREM